MARVCCFLVSIGLLAVTCALAIMPRDIDPESYPFSGKELVCNTTAFPPDADRSLSWHQFDLDQAPVDRWRPIMREYGRTLRIMIQQVIRLLRVIDVDGWLVKLVDKQLPKLLAKLPAVYREEIAGIADESGIPVGQVALFNIFYEVFTVCTSIVAEPVTGGKIHARNLDFGLFMGWDFSNHTWEISETLRRLSINVEVTRDNATVFRHAGIAGFTGVLTGVRPGFGLSIDERFAVDGGYVGLLEWIYGDRNQSWATWLAREVLEEGGDFESVKKQLQEKPLIAPVYYIISGDKPGEGTIVTRSRGDTVDTYGLATKGGRWYLLETNYDHWKKPFFIDNRRGPGMKCMNQSSADTITPGKVFNVLSTNPVLNRLTVYTALMDPVTGSLETYSQNCPSCYPW